jgi:hypothetical protein
LSIDYAYFIVIQISPKLFKIQPSRATPKQRDSKKKAWISLDSLGGIEPFQAVALTPWGKKSWSRSIPSQLASHIRLSFPSIRQCNTGF